MVRELRASAARSGGYLVKEHPDRSFAFGKVINPRRGATLSVPSLDWKQQVTAQDEIFHKYGLDDLTRCTTGEMRSRPVPHVFQRSETRELTSLFESWSGDLYSFIIPQLKQGIQTFNKTSRLGWPHFNSPPSKREVLEPNFDALVHEGVSIMEDAFIIMNVRLQAESKNKTREFLFVSRDGEVYQKKVQERDREISTARGIRVASRTRLVFNLPFANLLTQFLDTLMHAVLMSYPAFKHNMYSPNGAGVLQGAKLFFDVKHFERHTSEIVRLRAAAIGGLYGDIGACFSRLPFLCPSDDWKKAFFLWVDRESGFTDQFASGYSPVAGVQKEIFLVIDASFAVTHLGIPRNQALAWVAGGGDHRFRIVNYGDDNVRSGDPGVLKAYFAYVKQYLHCEEEDPPRFLGFNYGPNGWYLAIKSYLEKTYLNERRPGKPDQRSAFRRFPHYGWLAKRDIYAQYGDPALPKDVFPTEEALLARLGVPWSDIVRKGAYEAHIAKNLKGISDPRWLMGKDWLMTPEEKMATGEFDGYSQEETGARAKQLLSNEWKKKLSW